MRVRANVSIACLALASALLALPACDGRRSGPDAGMTGADAATARLDGGDASSMGGDASSMSDASSTGRDASSTGRDASSMGRDTGGPPGPCPDLNGVWRTASLSAGCDASAEDVLIMQDLATCRASFASMTAAGRSVNGIAMFNDDGSFEGMPLTIGSSTSFSCSGVYMTTLDPPRYVVECGTCRAELVLIRR